MVQGLPIHADNLPTLLLTVTSPLNQPSPHIMNEIVTMLYFLGIT